MRQALVNENADLVQREPPLRHAHHRQRHGGPGPARQFHRPGIEVPRARHHLAPALHRRRCADLPADRARPRRRLDDRVQADRRARHPRPRGHQEVLLHADRLSRRDQPLRRSGFRRRAGADLRARRGRPDHAARRCTADRRGRGPDPARARRGRDRSSIGAARHHHAARRSEARKKIYVDGVGATHHRRARRISRRERQARHREPARFHQEGAEEALRQPRRFPASAGRPPSASRRSSRNWRPRACRSIRSPRKSARTSIPSTSSATSPSTGRRSPAASAPRTSGSATSSPNTARRPAPCSMPCWRSTRTRASSTSTTHESCRSRPSTAMGTPVQLIKQFGTRHDFEQAVHELQSALYQEAA